MVRTTFFSELEHLKNDLMQMGSLIEQAIAGAVKALKEMDLELARDVMSNDKAINSLEKSIESRALMMMLTQQPVAKDLRVISTALKVVTDIERIGDQSSDIAEIVLRLGELPHCQSVDDIMEMASCAINMVDKAVTAFINEDVASAKETIQLDDQRDELFNKVRSDIIEMLKQDRSCEQAVDLLMIAKYLERIGDHAVNICEWAEFSSTGTLKNTKLL